MAAHISRVCSAAHLHLRNISRIRPFLSQTTTEQLVHAFVTSRLDMGNALLSGVTQAQLSRLQRVQNCAARLVTRTSRAEHITPVLEQLHWLPVKQRVIFKILLQVYRSFNNSAPEYICMRALRLDHWGPTPRVCSWPSQEPAQPGGTAALPRLVPSCGMPCQSTSGSLTRSPFSKKHWRHTFLPQPSSVTVKLTLKLPILVVTHLNVYVLGIILSEVLLVQLLWWHSYFMEQFQEVFYFLLSLLLLLYTCMCICICMCVYIHGGCMYVCMCVHMYMHVSVCACMCTCVCAYVYVFVYVSMYVVCIYMYVVCIYMYVYIYVCRYVYACVCVYMYICTCIYIIMYSAKSTYVEGRYTKVSLLLLLL